MKQSQKADREEPLYGTKSRSALEHHATPFLQRLRSRYGEDRAGIAANGRLRTPRIEGLLSTKATPHSEITSLRSKDQTRNSSVHGRGSEPTRPV